MTLPKLKNWRKDFGNLTEKDIQRQIVDTYRQIGMVVYDLSQPRATMQSPGLPDLFVCWPKGKMCWWFEVKRPKGRQTPAQKVFQETVEVCGVPVIVGGVSEMEAHLFDIGVLK